MTAQERNGAVVLPRPPGLAALSRTRRAIGVALAAVGLPLTTALLSRLPPEFGLQSVLLLYLLLIVGVTLVGGAWAAVLAAVGASLLANWFFTEPRETLAVSQPADVLALAVFLIVAGVTSVLVDLSARRSRLAARAKAESETLSRLTETALAHEEPLHEMVATLRLAFGLDSVSVLRREGDRWIVAASAGEPVPTGPSDASDTILIGHDALLALVGPRTPEADRRILGAFAAQLAIAVTAEQNKASAAQAAALAQANDLRGALLAAVSHDLRTPLASIKASVTSLLQRDVSWTPELTRALLETVNEETDRLDRLVGNLLDMSRLRAGAVTVQRQPTNLEDVVPAAVASLGNDMARRIVLDVSETLPQVDADPVLLERVVANVVSNALAYSPPEAPVLVQAHTAGRWVELCVVDRGMGMAPSDRERIFQPFQRLTDSGNQGVGLGLAVARGFTSAMDGELAVSDSDASGTTMMIRLRIV